TPSPNTSSSPNTTSPRAPAEPTAALRSVATLWRATLPATPRLLAHLPLSDRFRDVRSCRYADSKALFHAVQHPDEGSDDQPRTHWHLWCQRRSRKTTVMF